MNEEIKISSPEFITQDELSLMSLCPVQVERQVFVNKDTNLKRKAYKMTLLFDKDLVQFSKNLTLDEFALMHIQSGNSRVNDQFKVQAFTRLVKTDWPEHDGYKANSTYALDIYINKDLAWRESLSKNKFLPVILHSIKNNAIKVPIVTRKVNSFNEKEASTELENKVETSTSINEDKLPF